jgi:uncharacterized protein
MRGHASVETILTNQYLYRIQPVRLAILTHGPTETEAAVIRDHFKYLENLTGQGIVLMAGRTLTADERTFGIVVFVADSEEAATVLMRNDPAVSAGIMTAELFPFGVALWSTKGLPDDKGLTPGP